MMRIVWGMAAGGALLGAGALWFGATKTAQASEVAGRAAMPTESPGGGECYEWTYPKKPSCGKLSGTKECKTRPSIESSEDEAKKEDCKPAKGDLCLCD